MTTPYTYLIGWPELNTWYYGVRYAEGCSPADLWVTYFTSSVYVDEFVKTHGAPTHRQIRKIFTQDNIPTAKLWEHKVLRRMKVVKKEQWLNKNDRLAPPILSGDTHPKKRPEVRAKSSKSMLKVWENMDPITRENHRKNVGVASKNNWASMSIEDLERISDVRSKNQLKIEAKKTPERKAEISKNQSTAAEKVWASRTAKVKEIHRAKVKKEMLVRVSCIVCHTETNRTALTRFHNNCIG